MGEPATLYCDNKTVILIAANPIYQKLCKHIKIDCYLVQEKIKMGLIETAYISTYEQLVVIFNKSLGNDQHSFFLTKLGIRKFYQAWGVCVGYS